MSSQLQRRTAPGKSGRPVKIRVNAFECMQLPTGTVTTTAYILSEEAMPNHTHKINEDVVKKVKTPAGKEPKMLTIKIEHAAVVPVAALLDLIKGLCSSIDDTQTTTAMQALNIVMKMPPVYVNGYPAKGPKFYVPKENSAEGALLADLFKPQPVKTLLQGACELWGGYFASIRPGIGKMILNANRASAPLVKPGKIIDILMEYMNVREASRANPLNPQMPLQVKLKIVRFLKGMYVRVATRNPNDKFTIKQVDRQSARNHKFDSEFGQISVMEYFKKKHNITLKHPDMPVVAITKRAFYPLECCTVWPGSNFFKKLSAQQTSEMLKSRFVTLSPGLKRQAISVGLNQMSINSTYHQGWRLRVKPDFMEVGARQLNSPQLSYRNKQGQPQTVKTMDGAWMTKDLRGFRAGLKVSRWIVVVFAGDKPGRPPTWDGMPVDQVRDSLRGFIKGCKDFGIIFENEQPTLHHAGNVMNVKDQLVAACKKAGYGPQTPPELVVTYSIGSNQYDVIKRVCDVELGVPSQNLAIGKADGNRGGYWVNVALKVNTKLRGVNQVISTGLPGCNQVPTMLLGADVTHPSPGTFVPSIAALVASHDKAGVEYSEEHHIQESTLEIIGDLANMLTKHLKHFFAKNKVKPQRLVFYRDGVSEGQFSIVAQQEIAVIQDACQAMEKGYNPALTFIICAKRHHFQLFPVSDKEADRSGNAKAGTVVDTEVVHPSYDDFYLLSHAGLLGTSKCTHYTILLDENKLGKDLIQNLTYQSAYLMPRATRSISIAAPAQYAHLMCERARKWIGNLDAEAEQMSVASDMTDDQKRAALLKLARERPNVLHTKLVENMFYM